MLLHYNPSMAHQVRHAEAFADCGVATTPTPEGDADVHIVSGPHFALNRWRDHPKVLVIDRAYWDDPEYISIGWLQPDGSRKFASGIESRPKPACLRWKTREDSCLVLADYGQDVGEIVLQARQRFGHVIVRLHPADEEPTLSLETCLMLADVCIGTDSTALVEAVVMGVPAISLSSTSVVAPVAQSRLDGVLYRGDREAWLHDLSYRQFNHAEFGKALELLNEVHC